LQALRQIFEHSAQIHKLKMLLRMWQSTGHGDELWRHQGTEVHEEHLLSRPHGFVQADVPRLEEDHQEARRHGRIKFLRRLIRLRRSKRAITSQAFEIGQYSSDIG